MGRKTRGKTRLLSATTGETMGAGRSFHLRSLRLRLAAAAAMAVLAALTLSGFFLSLLFERYVERRVDQELSVYIKQLAAAVVWDDDGEAAIEGRPADPRFDRPLSGLYWQIETPEGVALRSRSLFGADLALPPFDPAAVAPFRADPPGPDGEALLARARVLFFEGPDGDAPLRLTAALDKSEIRETQRGFQNELIVALGLLALALLAASGLQIWVGLTPLNQLRRRVNAVRTGGAARLKGAFPSEVQPLVDEVNALLEANDTVVERAREGAADLAHGLKTPLAVLKAESRRLAEDGETERAAEIDAQVEAMRARVERHLAVVRLRGPGGGPAGRTELRASFEKLIRAMTAMPRGDVILWRLDAPAEAVIPMDAQDFFEVFGNLLDNARKWAAASVEIRAERRSDAVFGAVWTITVADDGPGLPEGAIGEALKRGGRLDERRTGAGLGLAIASRVLEAYGATLEISNRAEGGALIAIRLPLRRPL